MASSSTNVDLEKLTVPKLRLLLRERGIPSTGYNKASLLKLAREGIQLYDPLQADDRQESITQRITVGKTTLPPPDSCVISNTDDLKELPPVSLTDLLIYLRVHCKWGDERLRNYKQDDGHKMYKDDHITKVELGLMPKNPSHVYVKARCVPEQSQSAEQYKVWLLLQTKSGAIESAGCTCVAADDGTCKHVVALLFSCIDFSLRHVDRHTQVGTDIKCVWNCSRQESKPLPITDLDLRQKTSKPMIEPTPLQYIPLRTMESSKEDIDKELYQLLKAHAPNASVLNVMDIPDGEAIEENRSPTLTLLASEYKRVYDLTTITDMDSFVDFIKQRLTPQDISEIAAIPQGTSEWLEHRRGRLTGSVIGKVQRFRMNNREDNYLVKLVFEDSFNSNVPAIQYGNEFEPVARTLYLEEKEKEGHKKLTVMETGLAIDSEIPILGASPDGLVSCTCCGKSIIEIKCCHSRQDESAMDIAKSGTYNVYLDNENNFRLKTTTPWYDQMTAEMAVTGCTSGDFVLFTNLGIKHCKVEFSEEHWLNIKKKCKDVYEKFILPKL